jgi:hypothetical protein
MPVVGVRKSIQTFHGFSLSPQRVKARLFVYSKGTWKSGREVAEEKGENHEKKNISARK